MCVLVMRRERCLDGWGLQSLIMSTRIIILQPPLWLYKYCILWYNIYFIYLRFKASLPPFHLHLYTIKNPCVNSCIYFVQIFFNYIRRGKQMFWSQFKVSQFHPNSPWGRCKRNIFNRFIFKSIKLISKRTIFIRNRSQAQVSTLLKNLLASTFPFSECNT